MRQGKSIANYKVAFDYMIAKGELAMYTIDTAENIKENFKYFLNVNVNVKKDSENLYIISLNRNYKVSKILESIDELLKLAYENKAVYVTLWRRTSPAAWMIHMPLVLLNKWINNKYIYTITKKEEDEKQKG